MTVRKVSEWLDQWWIVCALVATAAILWQSFPWDGRVESIAAWGQLGDYFGGLLNPFIGIITVVLIIKGLSIQAKEFHDSAKHLESAANAAKEQLVELKSSGRRDVLLAQANRVFADIEKQMARKISKVEAAFYNPFEIESQAEIRKLKTTGRAGITFEGLMHEKHNAWRLPSDHPRARSIAKWASTLANLARELVTYLNRVDELLDGDTMATDYYRNRLYGRLRRFSNAGYIPAEVVEPYRVAPAIPR